MASVDLVDAIAAAPKRPFFRQPESARSRLHPAMRNLRQPRGCVTNSGTAAAEVTKLLDAIQNLS
jgi:hypothetical protein